jgi:hypothetical protein
MVGKGGTTSVPMTWSMKGAKKRVPYNRYPNGTKNQRDKRCNTTRIEGEQEGGCSFQ